MFRIVVLALLLAGCGQKGPLYLPEPAPVQEPAPAEEPEKEDERLPEAD